MRRIAHSFATLRLARQPFVSMRRTGSGGIDIRRGKATPFKSGAPGPNTVDAAAAETASFAPRAAGGTLVAGRKPRSVETRAAT